MSFVLLGILNSQAAGGGWAGAPYFISEIKIDGATDSWSYDTDVDSSGNIYLASTLNTNTGMAVSKLTADGVLEWTKTLALGTSSYVAAIDVGEDGAINVTGSIGASPDTIVAEYDSTGSLNFQGTVNYPQIWGSTDESYGKAIHTRDNPAVERYVVARYKSSSTRVHVNKYTTAWANVRGVSIWNTWFIAEHAAFSNNGEAHVAGYFDAGGFSWDPFVLKFNKDVTGLSYRRKYAQSSPNYVYGAAHDGTNRVVVTGYDGYGQFAIAHLLDNGTDTYYKRLHATSGSKAGHSAAFDSSGNWYVNTRDNSTNDHYFYKFNSSGVLQWQRKLTGMISTRKTRMQATASGLVMTGQGYDNSILAIRLPLDGSGTGTWVTPSGGSYTYSVSSETVTDDTKQFGAMSDGSTSSVSRSLTTSSYTDATATATEYPVEVN